MKRLIIAATLTLAASTIPVAVVQAQTAPAKSAFCDLAKGQKNLVAWNAYYHCLGPAPRVASVAAQARPSRATSQFCDLAKGQKNLVSWNTYYGCLNR
jgi:hypothetical protein